MQKRILAVHDLAGLGRSSLVPILTVLGAMGHQCVPLPTAAYSSHLALPGCQGCELTGQMGPALAQYTALGIRFDTLYAGFLSSAGQAEIVAGATVRPGAGLIVIDPVLGDNGKLYRSATPALCREIASLCARAHVITPNSTEAAVLLGREPSDAPRDEDEAREWARSLWARFGASVVLTGLSLREGELTLACCENGEETLLRHPRVEAYYPGTGDLFAAVLTGSLTAGGGLSEAALRAAGFVRACIEATEAAHTDRLLGVQFEPLLRLLWEDEPRPV